MFGSFEQSVPSSIKLGCEVLPDRINPAQFMNFTFTLSNGDTGSGWVEYDQWSVDPEEALCTADIWDFEITLDDVDWGMNQCQKLQVHYAYGEWVGLMMELSWPATSVPDGYPYEGICINYDVVAVTLAGEATGPTGSVTYTYVGGPF